MLSKIIIAAAAQALAVSAATHNVAVGAANTRTFQPNVINAQPGDTVQFNFQTANHSVVSSSMNDPCNPSGGANAIYSMFQPVTAGQAKPQFSVAVNSTQPMYIYCSQTQKSHCQAGMVMIINPPNGAAIQQMKKNAKNSGTSTSPNTGITGGTIKNNAAANNAAANNAAGTTGKKTGAKAGTAGAKAAAGAN